MTEENVTKAILNYLIERDWKILSFDFPQSGTGRSLHPRGSSSKNDRVLIPDVVAVKGGVSIYLENKDHHFHEDFRKVHSVLEDGLYAEAFRDVLGVDFGSLRGGVGLPASCCDLISDAERSLVDFVLVVSDEGIVGVRFMTDSRPFEF